MQTLKSYRPALIEVDAIQLQIDRLQNIGAPPGIRSTAPRLERVPDECLTPAERRAGKAVFVPAPRGTNNPEAQRMQELDEAERRLQEARARAAEIIRDFEVLLKALDAPNERLFIRLRFAEGKTPAETANIMGMSRSVAYAIYKGAISKLMQKFEYCKIMDENKNESG